MNALNYTVTVSNRTDIRQGWRVACIGMEPGNWNALGQRVHESRHTTEAAARKKAAEVAKIYNAQVL